MSTPGGDWDSHACREALEHPLRQTLFALLRYRPASALELQQALAQSLSTLHYHLGVLVQQGCLVAEREEGSKTYRVDPRAAGMLPPASETSRFLILSLLESAWAVSGQSPKTASVTPRWKLFQLDEAGLQAAAGVVADALQRIEEIADASQARFVDHRGASVHTLVAVASFNDPSGWGR